MSDGAAPGAGPAAPDPAPWWSGFVRRKGHIGPRALAALTALALLPLVLSLSRINALPDAESLPILGPLRELGAWLNQRFSLEWVPPADRPEILYLTLLPTGALLVALFRLTFGVRVLGLRAILIAIGFHVSGFLPSLLLMAVVLTVILVIRPWTRLVRLPLYARIALILGLSALIMVGALLIAPWLRSDTVWGVAFFPVIIMAMLAEGVAKTLEEDDAVTAAWRAVWTILLALLIALIHQAVAGFVFQFPELILTQLVAIVFVAEFLDLRLLEEWPARLARLIEGKRPWYTGKPRVAVVRNRASRGVVGHLGHPAPSKYQRGSVRPQVRALREQGFDVRVIEGDMTLLLELKRFLPPDPRRGSPGGIVLNLATGVQGAGRFAQVPAMLELAGVAYTGPDPVAHARLSDRLALLTFLQQAGVAVPRHVAISDPGQPVDLEFPLVAGPRFEPDARKIVARDQSSLEAAIREVGRLHGQPAVVEEIAGGREIRVALLGNDLIECLPLVESSAREGTRVCPAPLDEPVAELVRACARRAFRAAGCRDYARIDIRLSRSGVPRVVDVKWASLFARSGTFAQAAAAAGCSFPALMRRVVDVAARRYLSRAASRPGRSRALDSSVVSLADRRAAAE
ncbi:MAG: 7TM domain-containing protein [Candidatus Polarisedimenticolia bacterium]